MQRYIISYDLYRPANNYSGFTACIKQLGETWEHTLANLWIISTPLYAEEIRQILSEYLAFGDKLYICEVRGDEVAMDIAPLAHCDVAVTNRRKRATGRLLANVLNPVSGRETHLLMAAIGGN